MPLTDAACRNAKPKTAPYKLSDFDALYLLVKPTGSRLWRMDYTLAGKRRTLSIGEYPAIPLLEAREKRDIARKQVRDGVDPSKAKAVEKDAARTRGSNTFAAVAKSYIKRQEELSRSASTMRVNHWLNDTVVGPKFGKMPMLDIESPEVLAFLWALEERGLTTTVKKARNFISCVFRHGILTGKAKTDPTFPLRGALKPTISAPQPAFTDPKHVGALMRAIDGYGGAAQVMLSLKLLALTFVRPGEIRGARWEEFKLRDAMWIIPAERMKGKRDHMVPLSRQAIEIIELVQRMQFQSEFLFPSPYAVTKGLSNSAHNGALRHLGYHTGSVTAHGFRATASTILNDRGFRHDVIEMQLAHLEPNKTRRAYNRALYLEERVDMMQKWADMLDEFRAMV